MGWSRCSLITLLSRGVVRRDLVDGVAVEDALVMAIAVDAVGGLLRRTEQ
jgi:hypothetical protein